MIGVRFNDGTSVEYPDADSINASSAPVMEIVQRLPVDGVTVIAVLDANDIKEIYDENGVKQLAAA